MTLRDGMHVGHSGEIMSSQPKRFPQPKNDINADTTDNDDDLLSNREDIPGASSPYLELNSGQVAFTKTTVCSSPTQENWRFPVPSTSTSHHGSYGREQVRFLGPGPAETYWQGRSPV